MGIRTNRIGFAFFCMVFFTPVHADLVLTSPPRETAARGEEMYGPLAKWLTIQLKQNVVYEHPRNWIEYTAKMRKNSYDIIFDGPHFAAWRIKNLEHMPVAKLPGELSFVLVTNSSDKKLTNMRSLVMASTCGMASPNLATMVVLNQFNNPIIQPDIYEVASFKEGYEAFKSGKCKAAVFQAQFINKLSPEEKAQIKVLFSSNKYPDQTITTSKRVTEPQRAELTALLTASENLPATQEILKAYTKQAKHFDPATPQDYVGLENMLEEMWGW